MADSIASLQRKLKSCESEMERLTGEMHRQRERMRKEQQRELEALQREMERALQSKERAAEQKYQKLLEDYRDSIYEKYSKEMRKMQMEYEELKSKLEDARKRWEAQSEELARSVREIEDHEREKSDAEREEAEHQLKTLDQKLGEVEKLPSEVFRAGRLGIIKEMTASAVQFLKKGFCQSALGMAISALSDAKRLELETREGMEEWLMALREWETAQEAAIRMLEQEVTHAEGLLIGPVELSEEEKRSHDWKADMSYWSKGETQAAEAEILLHGEQIRAIRGKAPEQYLKEEGSLSTEEIRMRKKELEASISRLEEAIRYYQNAWKAHCDRVKLGESVIAYLEEQELFFLSSGFAAKDGRDLDEAWRSWLASYHLECMEEEEDYRDVLCICFTDEEGDLLAVSVRPVRMNSEVSNRLQYYMELGGALGGILYERGLLAIIRNAGREAMKNPAIAGIVTEDPGEIREENLETADDGFLPQREDREQREIVDMVHRLSKRREYS